MNDARLKEIEEVYIHDDYDVSRSVAEELITALRESQAREAKLREALENIVHFVHPNRERDWHLYPTRLRDQAILVLPNCKTYEQCESATRAALKEWTKP